MTQSIPDETVGRLEFERLFNSLKTADFADFPPEDDDGGFDGSDEALASIISYSDQTPSGWNNATNPEPAILLGIKMGRALAAIKRGRQLAGEK